MKNTKVRVEIIATLSVIAIVLGVIAFMPVKEPTEPVTIPTSTPKIIEFKLVTTPSPTPPPMPIETPILEAIEEVQPTPKPTKAPTVQPDKGMKVTGAFALGIDGSTVQVAHGVEEKTLEKSPGWLDTSASPGEEGVCVVYGHRNRNHLKVLKNVEVGGIITVTMSDGRTFAYIIESIEILDSMEELIIPTVSGSHLLLATCYPFHYLGHAPQKCVVISRLV